MNEPWWKSSVVYQIYPQSFQDSNHDGFGDLNGIRQRLDYLKELGVDVLWLNPIYQSPLVDNGYDISDYMAINPQYGTLEDFKALLEEAHAKGIRIIMDLVVNHTSDQHAWFQASKQSKDNPYSDFYIWKDPKEDGSAPTNWGATFGGTAWEYVPERGQYYLHCFAKEQPDLNWENPKVREAVYEQMRFWLDLGIDGFRMDVISLISKRPDYPDNDGTYAYPKSYYTGAAHGPRLHEFLQEMNEKVLSHYDVLTVGETPNTSTEKALLFTNPDRHELNMVFQFEHMHLDYGKYNKFSTDRFCIADLRDNLTRWQKDLEKGWNSLYWDNHDQPRAVSRFGNDQEYRVESAKMLGMLLHGMKGTPYVFQGEELGMRNVPFASLDDYQDIETRFMIEEMKKQGESEDFIRQSIQAGSRDNARTPMPWTAQGPYYGFSDHQPWIGCSPDNAQINAEAALQDPDSVFWFYRDLIALRKSQPVLINGSYDLIQEDHPAVYAYKRENQDSVLTVLCNMTDQSVPYSLQQEEGLHPETASLLLANTKDAPEILQDVQQLRPYEALMYLSSKS